MFLIALYLMSHTHDSGIHSDLIDILGFDPLLELDLSYVSCFSLLSFFGPNLRLRTVSDAEIDSVLRGCLLLRCLLLVVHRTIQHGCNVFHVGRETERRLESLLTSCFETACLHLLGISLHWLRPIEFLIVIRRVESVDLLI